jgi:glutamine cyclotransferase
VGQDSAVKRFRTLVAAGVAAALLAACAGDAAATSATSPPLSTTEPSSATTSSPPADTTTVPPSTTTAPPPSDTTTAPSSGYPDPAGDGVALWLPDVIAEYPHDPEAFTQGLQLHEGDMYETTGLYGESGVRRVDTVTGEVVAESPLAADEFGEGLASVDSHLLQLTWQAGKAYVWDPGTLEGESVFTYDGEGWGLCDLGDVLAMSDGTATLEFRDRVSFAPVGEVTVTLEGAPVTELNELECVDGWVFANVWKTTDVVVIEPSTGLVTAVVDGSELDLWSADNSAAVMNGIAYDPTSATFFVTGKLWPTMYEVRFVDG